MFRGGNKRGDILFVTCCIFLCLVIVSCSTHVQSTDPIITLQTEDSYNISGIYHKQENAKRAVIMVHMLNSKKESYNEFTNLIRNHTSTLAIDLRGHGASQGDWKKFSEGDFQAMVLDIQKAKEFLQEQGHTEIYLVGASVGANAVLAYAASDNDITRIVLLSPGITYRGISAEEPIARYTKDLLIVASTDDTYSFESSKMLFVRTQADKEFIELKGANHGTSMLDEQVSQKVADWILKS